MVKPRPDMLPDKSKTEGPAVPEQYQPESQGVETGESVVDSKTEPTVEESPQTPSPREVQPPANEPAQAEEPKANLPTPREEGPAASSVTPDEQADVPPKGHVPLSALQEERQRRKAAEARAKELEEAGSAPSEPEYDVEEDTDDEPTSSDPDLQAKVNRIERESARDKLLQKEEFAILNQHLADFDAYLEDNPNKSVEEAAKLFIFDNGLTGQKPAPTGVEAPSKGPKEAPKTQFSPEQLEDMRKNRPREYQRLVRSGALRDQKW